MSGHARALTDVIGHHHGISTTRKRGYGDGGLTGGTAALAAPPVGNGAQPASFAELVALLRTGGAAPVAAWLQESAHLIRFEPGRLELRLAPGAPADLTHRLHEAAARLTGRRWVIVLGSERGAPTLGEQAKARKEARKAELARDPALAELLAAYPGARLADVREQADQAPVPLHPRR